MKLTYSLNGSRSGELIVADADGAVVFADRLDLLAAKARRAAVEALLRRVGGDAEAIDAQLLRAAVTAKQAPPEESATRAGWVPSIDARNAAERLLDSDNLLEVLVDLVGDCGVSGERELIALALLVAVSRLCAKPLYLLIQGEPSSGKSHVVGAVAKLLPPSEVVNASDLTENALYYMDRDSLKGKLLLLGERKRQTDANDIDKTKALRELVESGRLSKLVPIKGPDGRIKTERLELEGCPAIIETCSHGFVAQEDQTRAIVVATDDSPEQTRDVLRLTAALAAGGRLPDMEPRIDAARAAIDAIEPFPVVNPHLVPLAERFPANLPEARRAFVRLAGVAAASALLHQRQRERRGDAVVVARDDLGLAWGLLRPWLSQRLAGGASAKALEVWAAVRQRTGEFTARELAKAIGCSKTAVSKALGYLIEQGAVTATGERFSRRFAVARPDWQPGDLDIEV